MLFLQLLHPHYTSCKLLCKWKQMTWINILILMTISIRLTKIKTLKYELFLFGSYKTCEKYNLCANLNPRIWNNILCVCIHFWKIAKETSCMIKSSLIKIPISNIHVQHPKSNLYSNSRKAFTWWIKAKTTRWYESEISYKMKYLCTKKLDGHSLTIYFKVNYLPENLIEN